MAEQIKVDGPGWLPGTRYGLGVASTPLSCGGLLWGHGGDPPGYHTVPGATDDGPAATIAVTANMAPTPQALTSAEALLDTALCKK
ncbi:hypothetical protein ABZX75_05045 [Streptomyces sp. NPDC003038]|uniref:hypothetical protein n=1 Tax=unclassified Streptomyces TaxID=2593676 RepID=UPI0033B1DCFF